MPTEWETYKNKCNFYSICVWCDIYSSSNIDSGVFPIGPNAFSCTEHLKKKQSQMLCQVKVLSKQKSEVLPCSVMLTGPHCQSDRAAHQTSAPTLLSRTKGAEKRCQIIWQAKWDIFIRSSTPSQTGANVSRGGTILHCKHQLQRRDQRSPFISASTQRYVPHSFSLQTE